MNILFYDAKLWGNTSHRDSNSGNLLMLFLALQEAWLNAIPYLQPVRFQNLRIPYERYNPSEHTAVSR